MAQISISISTLTSTVSTTDAKMKKVADLIYDSIGPTYAPGSMTPTVVNHTAQQKLDLVLNEIVEYAVERAKAQLKKVRDAEAAAATATEIGTVGV
jgi:hypothetical protein